MTTPDTPSAPSVDTAPAANIGSVLSADTVYQLRRFAHDNAHGLGFKRTPTPEDPPADDREVYDLLVFAARNIGRNPDWTLPRTLEALRVVKLVPENIGAAIFAKIEGH